MYAHILEINKTNSTPIINADCNSLRNNRGISNNDCYAFNEDISNIKKDCRLNTTQQVIDEKIKQDWLDDMMSE